MQLKISKKLPSDLPEFIQLIKNIGDDDHDAVYDPNIRKNIRSTIALHAFHAIRFGRPLDRAMLVFFGETGVGKSSTANNFFAKDLFKINHLESETKEIIELGVEVESDDISGILSLVDMPGVYDTDKEDEVKNFALITKFCSSNKSLAQREPPNNLLWASISSLNGLSKKVYPNAVLYLLSATDNRIKGNNTRFSRGLDRLKSTGLVDSNYPNLIIVVTHAANLAKNKESFIEKAAEFKKIVLAIVTEKLGDKFSNIPIVLVENEPDVYYAPIPEDSYSPVLLDGSKTYADLFTELCLLFQRNEDFIGNGLSYELFADLNTPKVIELSRLTPNDLNSSEINVAKKAMLEPVAPDVLNHFSSPKAEEPYMKTEIAKLLDDNGVSNISYGHIKQKIYKSGFTMVNDIKGKPISQIFDDLEYGVLCRLTDRLGMIDDLTVGYKFADKIGSFYDPVFQVALPGSVVREMPLDKVNRPRINGRIFFLPKGIKVQEIQDMSISMTSASDKVSYEEMRKVELGLAFKPYIACDSNGKWTERQGSSSSVVTFVVEKVINKVELDSNYVMQNIDEDLMQALENLPDTYDNSTKEAFHYIFKIYGPYFIAGQYVGGCVVGKQSVNTEFINPTSINSTLGYLKAFFGRMKYEISGNLNFGTNFHVENSSMANVLFQDSTTSLQCLGGDASKIVSESLHDLTTAVFSNWYHSVDSLPIGLERRYILKPISELLLDSKKKVSLLNAINAYTSGEFISLSRSQESRSRQSDAVRAREINEKIKPSNWSLLAIFTCIITFSGGSILYALNSLI